MKGIGFMKKKVLSAFSMMACALLAFTACGNDDEELGGGFDGPSDAKAGVYSAAISLTSESGEKTENSNTRGLDVENGQFTNEYPYRVIYLHKVDGEEGGGHKVQEIPLDRTPELCDSCMGIHLEVEVLDDADGGYIVRTDKGEEMSLGSTDSVYFSTIPTTNWTTTVKDDSPHGYDVFFQDQEKNKELLRSSVNYGKDELVALLQSGHPQIKMKRHCTAFRVMLMFTADLMGYYIIDEQYWVNTVFGRDAAFAPENFYIKLYMGPNYCHTFNVEQNFVPEGDVGGYYVTNNGEYEPFFKSDYAFDGGGASRFWQGYGYETAANNYLISPLNTADTRPFTIYAYVKYVAPGSDPAVKSDENSKWIEIPVVDFQVIPNRVHFIAIALNVNLLKVFQEEAAASQAKTRVWAVPEKIEAKPMSVIHTQRAF